MSERGQAQDPSPGRSSPVLLIPKAAGRSRTMMSEVSKRVHGHGATCPDLPGEALPGALVSPGASQGHSLSFSHRGQAIENKPSFFPHTGLSRLPAPEARCFPEGLAGRTDGDRRAVCLSKMTLFCTTCSVYLSAWHLALVPASPYWVLQSPGQPSERQSCMSLRVEGQEHSSELKPGRGLRSEGGNGRHFSPRRITGHGARGHSLGGPWSPPLQGAAPTAKPQYPDPRP